MSQPCEATNTSGRPSPLKSSTTTLRGCTVSSDAVGNVAAGAAAKPPSPLPNSTAPGWGVGWVYEPQG